VTEETVTAERRELAGRAAASGAAAQARDEVTAGMRAPPASKAVAASPADRGARLRAAAAAGDAVQKQSLLDDGVPVDSADSGGDSPLMKAIQSDRPAAAALLVRRGASLDRRNRAGMSARDMAAAKDDPALNRALGVAP
jgi:ankyrin repeat protein